MDARRLQESFFEMVAIESPSWHEAAFAAYCVRELEALGFQVTVDDSAERTGSDTGNVIAHLPGTAAGRIAFSAHLDTVKPCEGIVPVIGRRFVTREAVEAAVDAAAAATPAPADASALETVICPAGHTILSADDKAGIAAIFEGVRSVIEADAPHPSIIVVLTTCEEQSLLGSAGLSPDVLGEGTPCFVLDADGAPGSIVAEAPCHYTLYATFTGRAAHAGVEPEAGISAIQMAADAVAHMTLGRIDAHTTANIGTIAGGTAVNIVADSCHLEGECRSLYDERAIAQLTAMTAALEEAADRAGGAVEVRWAFNYPGIRLGADAPIVGHLQAAARAVGLSPRLTASGGGADANNFAAKGADAVTLGIGMTNFHTTDEFIAVRDLEDAARYVEAIIAEYAS